MKKDKFAYIKFSPLISVKAPKEEVSCTIYLHWIAARIIKGMQKKEIDLSKDSLRVIAAKVSYDGLKTDSPQMIKHHLESLVRLGALHIINATYKLKSSPINNK